MNKNQQYAMKYAEYAMEQMRRYGIPASVTLAQGILESSNGQSRLAQNENNHFLSLQVYFEDERLPILSSWLNSQAQDNMNKVYQMMNRICHDGG